MGSPCLRLVLWDWRGLWDSLNPSQFYRFGTLCLGLLDPFGGWVLGGLPFPTGRFWDGLGPGLSRLPPLQLLINCPLSIFCLQADNGVARSMAMNVAYRMRRGLGCLVPSSSLV